MLSVPTSDAATQPNVPCRSADPPTYFILTLAWAILIREKSNAATWLGDRSNGDIHAGGLAQ